MGVKGAVIASLCLLFVLLCHHPPHHIYSVLRGQLLFLPNFGYVWFLLSALCYHCCSVTKSHPTLCSPTDCNMPGFPVLHCLPEFLKLLSIELAMPSHHLLLCPLVTSSKSHQFTKALPLHTTTLGVRASDTSLGKAQFPPQH